MATLLDGQVGHVREVTHGTPVTVTRFHEFNPGNAVKWDAGIQQSMPIRVGAIGDRADREYTSGGNGKGTFEAPLLSKGFGVWLESCFGTATSTLVSGSTYQQLFTPGRTGTVRPAFTYQEGHPRTDGTVDAYTYAGCTVQSFGLSQPMNECVTLSTEIDAKSLATGTALATATLPSAASLFEFDQAVVQYGGTLTPPTTTAVASMSGGTTSTEMRSFEATVNNNIDVDRWNMSTGLRSQPTFGKTEISLSAEMEYQSTTWRDAYINRTSNALLITWTTTEALSTGFATLQIAVPVFRQTSPMPPDFTDGATPTFTLEGKVFDNLTQMCYVVLRTSDSAL